jgi:hypothetical protein
MKTTGVSKTFGKNLNRKRSSFIKMFETPLLFLIFNRPDETEKVFEVIRKVAPKHLYIAADGPRKNKEGESELCERVRDIVSDIDWKCHVRTLYREKNLGCKEAVSEAINWFFKHEEQGIILEDDCVPDISFFPYCEQLLEKYKNDETIISIGGTNLGYQFPDDSSYGFSRFMNMWGWATWRRSANLIDYKMIAWKEKWFKRWFLQNRLQPSIFAFDLNWIKYWKNYFNLVSSGKIDTWDYQWIFTQLKYQKLSVFPEKNLIKNVGFNNAATHTFFAEHQIAHFKKESISFPLIAPKQKTVDEIYESDYLKKIWFTYNKQSLYYILKNELIQKTGRLLTILKIKEPNKAAIEQD